MPKTISNIVVNVSSCDDDYELEIRVAAEQATENKINTKQWKDTP